MPGPVSPLRPPPRDPVMGWILAASFIAILLVPLATAWTQAQDLGHGWAVPLLIGYLWWERWGERPTPIARDSVGMRWWGAAGIIVLLAAPLRLLLTPFPLWPAALGGYVAVLVVAALGGAWLVAGRGGMRWVGQPLLLLLGALPWPSLLELKIVGPMREMLASAAAEVCYLSGVSALSAGTTLRLAHTWVGVDETCGGMRSLQASLLAALFFGEWFRLTWPRRIGLVGVGMVAAVLGNFLRILLLVWRASVGGEKALEAAHDAAGWLALATSLGLIGLIAGAMRRSAGSADRTDSPTSPVPIARCGLPRLAVAWMGSLVATLAMIEIGTRLWYWRGEAPPAATRIQWSVHLPERGVDFRAVPLSEPAREMLRPDFFAAGEWQDEAQRPVGAYYIEWRRGQAAHSIPFSHNPAVCLPMAGCELVRPIGTLRVPWAGGEIPFHAYLFRRANEEFAVGFAIWDTARGRPLENDSVGWQGWITARFQHVLEGRPDQPAQLLSVAVWGEHPEAHLAANIVTLLVRR